jgi:hypothetical protein
MGDDVMSVAVSIDFPKEDVQKLMAQMKRAQKALNMRQPQVVKMGATHVLSALADSTKIGEPYREYQDTGKTSRSGKNKVYVVQTRYQTPKRKGKALRRSWQGPLRGQIIYAKNERELKRRPAVIIAMRGVARQSWMEAGKKAKLRLTAREKAGTATAAQARAAQNKRRMRKAARRWVEYSAVLRGDNPYIKVTNRIRHINEALNGGQMAVATAMSRAADKMEKKISGILAHGIKI